MVRYSEPKRIQSEYLVQPWSQVQSKHVLREGLVSLAQRILRVIAIHRPCCFVAVILTNCVLGVFPVLLGTFDTA